MNSLVDAPFFHPDGGQNLQQRLLQPIGTRSRRQAAEDWGIKYATLNNYLTARKSYPRPKIVKQIADACASDKHAKRLTPATAAAITRRSPHRQQR